MTVSELRTARERAGISQEQLAARLRDEGLAVERTAISYWERHDAVPDDLRPVLARVLRAPELLPGRGLVFECDAMTALAWVEEELQEAQEAAERVCRALRRGEDPSRWEDQLWDLYTALDSYFAARVRAHGVDLTEYARRHRAKVEERHGARKVVAA